MRYFKSLGQTTAERFGSPKISTESLARASGTTVDPSQATGIVAMEQIKAAWPKRTRTFTVSRDGVPQAPTTVIEYVWKFVDGTTRYTQTWNNEYYLHVKNGTSPTPLVLKTRVPDLSNVVKGSRDYFRYLCMAQGPGGAGTTAQGVRIAFDRRGWVWQPTADLRGRALSPPYASREKPRIPLNQVDVCSTYVAGSKTERPQTWANWAYNYSTNRVQSFIESRESATVRTHIAAKCKEMVPPEQVAACEAYVNSGRGVIEDFITKVNSGEMTQEEFDALTVAGGGKIPGSGIFGIPTVYLAAGGVGVVILGALLLKGKRK